MKSGSRRGGASYSTPEERNAIVVYTENQGLLKLLREVGLSKSDSRIETIRQIFLLPRGVTLYTTPEGLGGSRLLLSPLRVPSQAQSV